MKMIIKAIFAFIANAIGLMAAAYFISGFILKNDFYQIGLAALILTALNFFLKPILKLVLGPIIFLTLGLGLIIVNAIILYLLDILSPALTIENIAALIYASLIIGLVNFIFHLATK